MSSQLSVPTVAHDALGCPWLLEDCQSWRFISWHRLRFPLVLSISRLQYFCVGYTCTITSLKHRQPASRRLSVQSHRPESLYHLKQQDDDNHLDGYPGPYGTVAWPLPAHHGRCIWWFGRRVCLLQLEPACFGKCCTCVGRHRLVGGRWFSCRCRLRFLGL